MRIIKLDRRYKGHTKYSVALQFGEYEFRFRRAHWPYRDALKQMFGEETHHEFDEVGKPRGRWTHNKNYMIDRVKFRISLKDPEVITWLQLMVP